MAWENHPEKYINPRMETLNGQKKKKKDYGNSKSVSTKILKWLAFILNDLLLSAPHQVRLASVQVKKVSNKWQDLRSKAKACGTKV